MANCGSCGKPLGEGARFCVYCGRPASPGAPADIKVVPEVARLSYKIEGDNLQVLRMKLAPGQKVYAEAGKMVYKTDSVFWETRASGVGLGQKLLGMLKRTITGESLFFTYFRCDHGEGEVAVAGVGWIGRHLQ